MRVLFSTLPLTQLKGLQKESAPFSGLLFPPLCSFHRKDGTKEETSGPQALLYPVQCLKSSLGCTDQDLLTSWWYFYQEIALITLDKELELLGKDTHCCCSVREQWHPRCKTKPATTDITLSAQSHYSKPLISSKTSKDNVTSNSCLHDL